ncbi:MAG: tetratricopeptide repeat protein, partial [Deltaproteobacteria bacterium]|nr:tetratricopeptide repeat protein [Deltaproteobacteria bacterium]
MNIASAVNNQGLVYKEMRRFDEALAHFEKALQIAARIGDRSTASYSYGNMGTVHHDRGDFGQALEMYRRRLELTTQLGDRQSSAYTRINMGLLEKQRGRYKEAEALYLESLKVMTELGDRRAVAITTGKLADLFFATGRMGLARQGYREAVEQARQLGIDYYLCDMLNNFALLALEENDHRESSELAALAKTSAEKAGRKDMALSCLILQARLLSYENKEQAVEELKKLEGECPDDEQRSEALYHLYRLEPEEQLKEKLLKVYGALLERTPDQKYQVRINEIAGAAGSQPGEHAT